MYNLKGFIDKGFDALHNENIVRRHTSTVSMQSCMDIKQYSLNIEIQTPIDLEKTLSRFDRNPYPAYRRDVGQYNGFTINKESNLLRSSALISLADKQSDNHSGILQEFKKMHPQRSFPSIKVN